MNYPVVQCAEWRRVHALPICPSPTAEALAQLTRLFSRGTAELWSAQALLLWHWARTGGLWASLPVGAGKTLVTLLAPWFVQGTCVLYVPAKLRDKTLRERDGYAREWRLPENLIVRSYESLQTVKGAASLDELAPAAILCDEAHAFKRPQAARTRRFRRYLRKAQPRLGVLSGSFMRRSLLDFHHLVVGALGGRAPLPVTRTVAERWAQAVDPGVDDWTRPDAGALRRWCLPQQARLPSVAAARAGLSNRISVTAGCVIAPQAPLHTALEIRHRPVDVPRSVSAAIDQLKASWETPNGDLLCEQTDVWRIERQMICGFWYRWVPPPPKHWLDARREWHCIVRAYLGRGIHGVDSPAQVALYLPTHPALGDWRRVRDDYRINKVPQWIDDYMLRDVTKWLREGVGLVWTEHVSVGERLAELTGVPYFGGGDAAAAAIMTHTGSAILSVKAHSEGRNLQDRYHRNLVLCPPSAGLAWEQLLGRTYRHGQTERVTVDVYLPTDAACAAMARAIEDADAQAGLLQCPQRLQMAHLDLPQEVYET